MSSKEEFSKKINELREANERLKMKIQADSTDGRRGEATIVKSSQVNIQSIPDKPKQLVQESITSSKKRHPSIEDHDIHRVLEDVHKEPVSSSYRRDPGGRNDPYTSANVGTSYGSNTRDMHSGAANTRDTFSGSTKTPYGKQSSEEEYRLEDIEAELESLREDLARTREVRHAKPNVKYVSDENPPGRTRTVSSERGVDSSQGTGAEGKRVVITTASFARVPRQDSSEYRSRQGSQDRKVSKLIEMFSMPGQNRNSHKRASSGDNLSRSNRSQRSRSERPKSAIDFEAWKRVLNKNNQWN
jgi:hypothetical protein